MTDKILIIHESHKSAMVVVDALRQMHPSCSELFVPVGLGGTLVGIGITYAVWFCELPDRFIDWKNCNVDTRFYHGATRNLAPKSFQELMEKLNR